MTYDECTACRIELPLAEFDTWVLRDTGAEYRRRQCRNCINTKRRERHAAHGVRATPEQRAERREYERRWRTENRATAIASQRLCKYGITQAEYDELVAAQCGECAICRTAPARLQVDHDHQTGKVRGLLCGNCNKALGLLKDSQLSIANAASYLKGEL